MVNQTWRAMQRKLRAITLCPRVCQGAMKKYLLPADQHRSPYGSAIADVLLIPLTIAKFGYKCESPSQTGGFVPRQEEQTLGGKSQQHPPVKWMLPGVFPLLSLLHA